MSDPSAPLHPDRIREALKHLREECTPGEFNDTCRAALELVRKGQLAVGLTANTVDAFNKARGVAASGIELIEQISRIGKVR